MAEAARLPNPLVAYTNSDWNEEPLQFFIGSTTVPDGPFVSAKMGLRLPAETTNTVELSTDDSTLTISVSNAVDITAPLSLMQTIGPALYNFDLVVTYASGDIETVLSGHVMIVEGIS